ncbi:hypothetical protein PGT21_036416 [Puccinia graminis f. sp. tritici]|uniref:Uncharacterized protein n=1 Tax=Puccinia graminis f. sp. tritici TaxID=56615 RepID=A0A5B0R2Z8_PUCGR|nr:hypothetical protein PGT21_036416 [Puccinia graminis f. sp. tritici]
MASRNLRRGTPPPPSSNRLLSSFVAKRLIRSREPRAQRDLDSLLHRTTSRSPLNPSSAASPTTTKQSSSKESPKEPPAPAKRAPTPNKSNRSRWNLHSNLPLPPSLSPPPSKGPPARPMAFNPGSGHSPMTDPFGYSEPFQASNSSAEHLTAYSNQPDVASHCSPTSTGAPGAPRTPAKHLPPPKASAPGPTHPGNRGSGQRPPTHNQGHVSTPVLAPIQGKPLPSWEQLTADAEASLAKQQASGQKKGTTRAKKTKQQTPRVAAAVTQAATSATSLTPTSGNTSQATSTAATANPFQATSTAATATVSQTKPASSQATAATATVSLTQPVSIHVPATSLGTEQQPSVPRIIPASKRPLEDNVVAMYRNETLDELRRIARQIAENHRLSAEHKLELDAIYDRYQRELHEMAIKHKMEPAVALSYVGNKTRIRGPSSYNNFCVYNPEASAIHHDYTKHYDDRARLTAALWRKLDKTQKAKYRNPDYLETFSNPYIAIRAAAEAAKANGVVGDNDDEDNGHNGPKKS